MGVEDLIHPVVTFCDDTVIERGVKIGRGIVFIYFKIDFNRKIGSFRIGSEGVKCPLEECGFACLSRREDNDISSEFDTFDEIREFLSA